MVLSVALLRRSPVQVRGEKDGGDDDASNDDGGVGDGADNDDDEDGRFVTLTWNELYCKPRVKFCG